MNNIIDYDKFPYSEIRPSQKKILDFIDDKYKDYRYFICELNTGIGKSAIAKTICSSVKNSYIITATKQLQDQYMNDFKNFRDISSIKGKSNYICPLNDSPCDKGACLFDDNALKECSNGAICPYVIAKNQAKSSKIFLTSYQYFFNSIESEKSLKPRNIILFDECHLLENQIITWAKLELSIKDLSNKYKLLDETDFTQFVQLSVTPDKFGYENNKEWLNCLIKVIIKKRNKISAEIKDKLTLIKAKNLTLEEEECEKELLYLQYADFNDLDRFCKKLDIFLNSKSKENNWLIEPLNDGLVISPINCAGIFHQYINSLGINKIIFMSATILDARYFMKSFGLSKEITCLIRKDSDFDYKKSPIIYKPICKMNFKNIDKNLPKILNAVKDILEEHKNEKGVIHTGNYKITEYLQNNLYDDRLIVKTRENSNEDILRKHILYGENTVLVSPSLTTGVNLNGDLSRFQIIIKAPFLNLADKYVQKKMQCDKDWYVVEMFRTLIQCAGRSTRSKDDWSKTYILDNSFKSFVNTNKRKNWFFESFLNRIIW